MDLILSIAIGLVGIPVAVLAAEIFAALVPRREAATGGDRHPVVVLIPAHDEASVIGPTLESLAPELSRDDRLLVVADNCADSTATIARAHGAEVIERVDPMRRGKGYALDFGVRHLEADPPGVVVVIDADCLISPGSLDRLARLAVSTGRPIQGLYLMRAPRGSGIKARVGEFAWVVKNLVRPLGLARVGLPCPLTGTGMAFPWTLLRDADLASGHIVEDMKLGLDLARLGHPPLFCPAVLVTSEFPVDPEARRVQRTRWEHGHLGLIVAEAPRLLGRALWRGDPRLFAMVLDLAVPPLAMLALLVVTMLAAAGLAAASGLSPVPLYIAGGELILLTVTVLLAWRVWGRRILSLRELAFIPLYAAGKLPMYLTFWSKRQTEWVRTRRE